MSGPTLVYFAERRPEMDRTAFTRRWRAHGALGMSLPRWRNVAAYVQCDALPDAVPLGLRRERCDGVALVTYRSEAHRLAHGADKDARKIMRRDERETFARPVAESAMLCADTVFKPRVGNAVLFLLVSRRRGFRAGKFARAWREHRGPALVERLERTGCAFGYVQHHRRFDLHWHSWPFFDCLDELTFEAPMKQLRADILIGQGGARFVGAAWSMWTARNVLHDAPDHS